MLMMKGKISYLGAACGLALAAFGVQGFAQDAGAGAEEALCVPVEVSVFYRPGDTDLNKFSERVLAYAVSQTAHCELARVEVKGFADATGDADVNLKVSQERAETVMSYLKHHGVDANVFEVEAKGEDGALDENGRAVLMRRKADLRIIPVRAAA